MGEVMAGALGVGPGEDIDETGGVAEGGRDQPLPTPEDCGVVVNFAVTKRE